MNNSLKMTNNLLYSLIFHKISLNRFSHIKVCLQALALHLTGTGFRLNSIKRFFLDNEGLRLKNIYE